MSASYKQLFPYRGQHALSFHQTIKTAKRQRNMRGGHVGSDEKIGPIFKRPRFSGLQLATDLLGAVRKIFVNLDFVIVDVAM